MTAPWFSLAGPVALATAGSPTAAIDPAPVIAARDAVLASPEFNLRPDWQTRFFEWFLHALENAGAWLPAGLRVYFLLLLLAGLVALAWWLLPGRSTPHRGPHPGVRGPLPADAGNASAHQAAARAALAEGRLADCVRAVWNGAVVLLDQAGISRGSSARADWEHVEAARRSQADLVPSLSALVTSFQRSHFGAVPLARAEAEACLDLLGGLEQALHRRSEAIRRG